MANRTLRNPSDILSDDCEVIVTSSEWIPERLYFVVVRTPFKPKFTENSHFFTIDDELIYDPYLEDFGPLNLALLYRYCVKLNFKLQCNSLMCKKIIHYTTLKPKKRVNAAFLAGAYAIIYLNMRPNEVYNKLNKKEAPPFRDFRDASNGFALYKISLLDCLNAVYQAHKQNFFNFNDFNVQEYEYYGTLENGDLNWIVPSKFLAFAGPQAKPYLSESASMGYPTRTPESFIKYFRENNVTTIVRLNNILYDAAKFTREGFTHKDLYFIDGSTPSDDLVHKFLAVSESTAGAVAVHCKAGLGRTGSMIACYIMKWYKFSARETIAWLRICRPASIIGHQQEWLEMKQAEMWALHSKVTPPKHKYGIYSIKAKAAGKGKVGNLKPARAVRPLPIDNVSRISNKVDSMSIDNQNKDENKNNEVILDKESNVENYSFGEYSLGQGDLLNEIKASRLSRGHSPRVVRKSWSPNAVNSTKRVIAVEKVNATHPRRPLTRSKSSQPPPVKSIIPETNRTNSNSAPSSKMNVPSSIGMTLRSNNRLYSLRHPRTPETRLCKATSVR